RHTGERTSPDAAMRSTLRYRISPTPGLRPRAGAFARATRMSRPSRPAAEEGKTAIQVIERMVSLLDALAAQPDAVSLKDLSARTGLHPSTAHRILNDLVTARFVDRPEAGTYQLGMRLLELGNLVKARLNV